MKKHIPNIITLFNLAAGVVAVLFASQNQLENAAYFVFAGILFDFFDGFAARVLDVKSELGLQLDSLADMVTSGVVPGIVLFQLLKKTITDRDLGSFLSDLNSLSFLPFIGIIITLAAGYRLAMFNVDDRQSVDFIGLPTPSMSIFIVSLPLVSQYSNLEWTNDLLTNSYFLVIITLLFSYLMNSELRMFSLKFSSNSFKENNTKYIFLALSLALLFFLKIAALPFIIGLYILISIGKNVISK